MTSLFTRLPPLRDINRDLLLVGVTLLLWIFDLAWDLALTGSPTADGGPDRWHDVIGPRVVEHLLLLPILILCYLAAMRVNRLVTRLLPALGAYAALGALYALLVHPCLYAAMLLLNGDFTAAQQQYYRAMGNDSGPLVWVPYLLNFMVYVLGLFVMLGVNARLDLENERNRTSELYALWLNARLDTLRGQLNPHFLFNSLHTISSLLFTDTRRADKLLADFSDVLRTTLREGQREFSTVREEMDYARRYLSIEETRFEDRLITRFAVDETCLGARVPSLILQPLIENAIKYGISNSAGANHVAVEAARRGDTLVLEVSNDFRADAQPVSADRKMGIGLTNIRERLMAIYGADYLLSSSRLPGNRWSTRITLPFQEALWL